jgi:hypothetical protein
MCSAGDVIVGYEVDGCELTLVQGRPEPTFADGTPAGFEVLGTAPARLLSITEDECEAPEALWASTEPPGDLQGGRRPPRRGLPGEHREGRTTTP